MGKISSGDPEAFASETSEQTEDYISKTCERFSSWTDLKMACCADSQLRKENKKINIQSSKGEIAPLNFLTQPEEEWQQRPTDMSKISSGDPEAFASETSEQTEDYISKTCERFSSWTDLKMAWILRYKGMLRRQPAAKRKQENKHPIKQRWNCPFNCMQDKGCRRSHYQVRAAPKLQRRHANALARHWRNTR